MNTILYIFLGMCLGKVFSKILDKLYGESILVKLVHFIFWGVVLYLLCVNKL